MPTATATVTSEGVEPGSSSTISLKALKPVAAESSTAATLRSLYPRAAKAFLRRDFALTHSLITSAFSLIHPPTSATEDELASHRRKWDILRVTLETTVYTSPPPSDNAHAFPAALRANQTMSPQTLMNSLHERSLRLFTPAAQKSNSTFLPHQIAVTLVSAGVKLGCSEVSRGLIEDWLAHRIPDDSEEGRKGYAKILELYCLQVLPRLEEWQYAEDFLAYERELDTSVRANMVAALHETHQRILDTRSLVQAQASLQASRSAGSSTASSSRSVSPAPSTSSESSTSTHTATPRTPHPEQKKGKGKERSRGTLNGLTRFTPTATPPSPTSEASVTTANTIIADPISRRPLNPQGEGLRGRRGTSTPSSQARTEAMSPIPRPPRASPIPPSTTRPPTTLALVRSYLQTVLGSASRPKVVALFFVFVVLPVLSLFVRVRRRRLITGPSGTAEQVRRRLRGAPGTATGATGLVAKVWEEVVRAIADTIRMGGGGLA